MNLWLRGILISVIASLVVWFLTSSSYSPFVDPKVTLADVNVPAQMASGEEFSVSFRATNQRAKALSACDGFVDIGILKGNGAERLKVEGRAGQSPGERNGSSGGETRAGASVSGGDTTSPTVSDTTATDRAEPTGNGRISVRREAVLSSSLPEKPVIADAVEVSVRPQLLTKQDGKCQILTPEFTLRGVSGSAVQVVADCKVPEPGVYQMTYGIHCAKDERSQWRLDHRGYIKIAES